MFTEPDTISLFCLLIFFLLGPYHVWSNPLMIIISVDGHHLAFYMTEHNYSVFCNQKQGSTKNDNANLSGNLYGATFFSSLASLARYLNH